MKARRRRPTVEDYEDDNGTTPTIVDVLLGSFVEPVVKTTVGKLKHGVRTAVDWTVQRLIAGGVVAGILIAGILLVLAAGVKGLEALRCPLWLCYLSMGVVAVIAALLILKRILPRERDEELD